MSKRALAWEFLRRNEEYVRDWQKLFDSKDEKPKIISQIGQALSDKWQVAFMPNPDLSPKDLGDIVKVLFLPRFQIKQTFGANAGVPSKTPSHKVWVELDLRLSKEKNLSEVERIYNIHTAAKKPKKSRSNPRSEEKYTEYLKCYDLRERGLTFKEIALRMAPNHTGDRPEETYRQMYLACQKMIDGGYKDLL